MQVQEQKLKQTCRERNKRTGRRGGGGGKEQEYKFKKEQEEEQEHGENGVCDPHLLLRAVNNRWLDE